MRNQKYSTIMGSVVLLFFCVIIFGFGISHRIAANKTRKDLSDLAQRVADNYRSALMGWAAGNSKDQWGNTFVLESNGAEVKFLSKGPDGTLGSKDDIYGDSWPKKQIVYEVVIKESPPEEQKPSLLQKAWGKYKSWSSE